MSRCWIKTPGNPLALILPVAHTGEKRKLDAARIVSQENWQIRYLRSIESNYRKSAYFEQYFPEVEQIVLADTSLLSEINQLSCRFLWEKFRLGKFPEICAENFIFPEDLLPSDPLKHPDAEQDIEPWYQLYGDFVPGLSSLDILFHEGPEAQGRILKNLRTNQF